MKDSRYISVAELRWRMHWEGFGHKDITKVCGIVRDMPDTWYDPDDPPEVPEVYLVALEDKKTYVYVDMLEWSDGKWLKVPEDTRVVGWLELPSVRSLL